MTGSASIRLAPALWLSGLSACSAFASPGSVEDWAVVQRGDLQVEVDVTGTLRAVRSSPVGNPDVPGGWDFKIVRILPEGTEVKKGTPVIIFDSSEMDVWLEERSSERDRADKDWRRQQHGQEMAIKDADLKVAEAESAARRAAVKADLPAKYTAEVIMKIAKLDAESANAELSAARKRREQILRLNQAELAFLKERVERATQRMKMAESAITKLAVPAPVDGIVVYRSNWHGEKRKVGDSCYGGDPCLEVVDVSDMTAKGEVEETESARVAVGQPVTFHLDAFPEVEWEGEVQALRPQVYRRSVRNPLKVIGIDIKLTKTDAVRMRPGMQLRGRIETDRVAHVLLLPLEAVFVRADGPVAFRKTATGHEVVRLTLGKRNRGLAEVVAGLREGDQVARRDLAEEPRS